MLRRVGHAISIAVIISCVGWSCSAQEHLFDGEWNRLDRGRLVFISSGVSPELPHSVVVLRLPEKQVTELRIPSGVVLGSVAGPIWAGTDKVWVNLNFGDSTGVYQVSTSQGLEKRILESGTWQYAIDPSKHATPMGNRPAPFRVSASTFDRAEMSGACYAVVSFFIDLRIEPGMIETDPEPMADWIRSRATAQVRKGIYEWSDLIVADTSGSVRNLTEFPAQMCFRVSVNRAETHVLLVFPESIEVYDLEGSQLLVPSTPEGTSLITASFSPDGSSIAAVGWDSLESGVYMCQGPNFPRFTLFRGCGDMSLEDVCWSPDQEWLMLHNVKSTPYTRFRELLALEIRSGSMVPVRYPLLSGARAAKVYVDSGTDWIR